MVLILIKFAETKENTCHDESQLDNFCNVPQLLPTPLFNSSDLRVLKTEYNIGALHMSESVACSKLVFNYTVMVFISILIANQCQNEEDFIFGFSKMLRPKAGSFKVIKSLF